MITSSRISFPFTSRRFLRAVAYTVEALRARACFENAPVEVEAAYDFVEAFSYRTVRLTPSQIRDEILGLLSRLSQQPPGVVLELGTFRGGTLFLFTRVATPDATIVTVDTKGGPFGGGYYRGHVPLLKSLGRENQKIHLIRGDSHSQTTYERVAALVGEVDFLFIDGDHTYEGVRSDFEMYGSLVRPGGLIAFHDIVDGPLNAVGGVPRFWRELTALHTETEEFVADPRQGGYGIGLIRMRRDTRGGPK